MLFLMQVQKQQKQITHYEELYEVSKQMQRVTR